MSRKYKVRNPEGVYFITCTTVGWVDLFIRQEYKDILVNSLSHCIENKGLVVHAFVIMSSHIHLIVSTTENTLLPNVMRDFKSFTSKMLIREIMQINESRKVWMLLKFEYEAKRQVRGAKYKLWQDGYHPVELLTESMVIQKLDYIHNNPVADRIVDEVEEFVYSSARQYAGKSGLLEIEFVI